MISIIVPVYKAEKYIHRCIDSILAQSHTDFELLLIDDGSPDNCGAMCDEYAAQDGRVRVFHKENGGVSSARNLGIVHAQGEWITFIDADDYVHPDFLSSLYAQHDADLIVGSFQLVGSDESWDGILPNEQYGREVLRAKLEKSDFVPNHRAPWGKLYCRDIIVDNHILYDPKVTLSEDWLFTLEYFQYTHSIRTIDAPYYYYERGNVDGLSQNSRYFEEYFYAMERFEQMSTTLEQSFALSSLRHIYIESVRVFFVRQISYLYHHTGLTYHARLAKLRTMLASRHVQAVIHDTTIISKGARRRVFDFMARLFPASFLLFYIRCLKGNAY